MNSSERERSVKKKNRKRERCIYKGSEERRKTRDFEKMVQKMEGARVLTRTCVGNMQKRKLNKANKKLNVNRQKG